MGTKKQAGFTILEVMLVLAITGLMLVGVLAGSSAQVQQQEYRDSVRSLQSELQGQYNDVQNPTIDHTLGETQGASCGTDAGGVSVSRGASANCFVVGRLITSNDGQTLTESSVLGVAPAGNSSQPIDSMTISVKPAPNVWQLIISQQAVRTYTANWGTTMKVPNGLGGATKFSVLVIMSPTDGSLRTYTLPDYPATTPSDLYKMIIQPQTTLNLCVTGGSGMIFGSPLAVQIPASTSSAAGIAMASQSDGVCSAL